MLENEQVWGNVHEMKEARESEYACCVKKTKT